MREQDSHYLWGFSHDCGSPRLGLTTAIPHHNDTPLPLSQILLLAIGLRKNAQGQVAKLDFVFAPLCVVQTRKPMANF